MDLTNYAALNITMTKYSKVNSQFSLGRARVFYEGPNPNRTIFDADMAEKLIQTIPGTPIVGRYNSEEGDFEGHGEGQMAYGFVPLDPHPLKVEVTEEILGLPVKRKYYEVDAVIWDGRFPEAQKILEEEKSLSMELNPDTLDGEFEIYDDKHYLRVTNAEFRGITVLGDGHTPCFKDAKFLQAYTRMLNAYEALEQESNIGGTNMPNAEEQVEVVEVEETDSTISNEEAAVEVEISETEQVEETEAEEVVETPTEEGVEEGTEEETEAEVESEVEEETEEVEAETEEETEVEENSTETEEEPEVEEETEAEVNEETEALKAKVEELTEKLEVYENAAKEELVNKFSSKINDADFINDVRANISSYTVEDLKSTLGSKLAEQVLVEESGDENEVNGMVYSFNGVAKKETKQGWQALVRATKEAANNNK